MEHQTLPPPSIDIISGSREGLTLRFTIHGMWVEDTIVDGINYQVLSIPECAQVSDPGKPMLPFINKMIAIDPQSQVRLNIDSLEFIFLDNYYVYPAQYPQNDSVWQEFPFAIDEVLYAQNIFYPENIAEYNPPAIFRDLRVTNLSFSPIFFNPQARQLKVLKKVILRADFTGTDTLNILPSWPASAAPPYNAIYQSAILNYNTLGVPTGIVPKYQYLIISDASYTAALSPLIFWKRKKGLDVFLETVYQPTPNEIKTIITNYYNNYHVDYVLLIGDGEEISDPNGQNPPPHIPIYYGWPYSGGDYIRSDYWYATITADDIADVALGRFSVWTPEQLTRVIDKLFSFERYPNPNNWFIERNILASWIRNDYHACKTDSVVPIITLHGFQYYDDYGGWTSNALLKSHINNSGTQKGSSLLNYRGHGFIKEWPDWNYLTEDFTNNDIRSFTNFVSSNDAWLPIVFEIACCCGRAGFNLTTDTTGHSECWFRWKNGGGVAALGATRPSYTDRNHKFDTELYRVSFGDPIRDAITQELGWVINEAKVKMAEQYGWNNQTKDNVRMYHLMGDPEIDIYTGWNGHTTANHPTSTIDVPQTFVVTVYDEGNNPLHGALVCLYQQSGLHRINITRQDGQVGFYITPRPGWLYITVTKHDYGPYEGSCYVWAAGDGPQEEASSFLFAFNSALYNPQTRSVNIAYQVPMKSQVEIAVIDAIGRTVKIVETDHKNAGAYQSTWNCRDDNGRAVSQGIYFIKLKTGEFEEIKKVVIF
ncbi:MAG: C25 family cysteine peptidase [bacterium]